jgi:hypothetical protein
MYKRTAVGPGGNISADRGSPPPNEALQRTAATYLGLPGREVSVVAAAAELGR